MPAIKGHECFVPPADTSIKVWRYMNLARFIWLLQSRSLYFARSDLLGDPYEGYYTERMVTDKQKMMAWFIKAIGDVPSEKTNETAELWYYSQVTLASQMRKTLYVNCWHMNSEESLAMWKLYSTQNEAVCIQSTFDKLQVGLPDHCFLGTVRYIDYKADWIQTNNALQYIVHKRRSFTHEQEVRAVIWAGNELSEINKKDSSEIETAKIVPVDLEALIEDVYVSPTSEPLLRDVVSAVLDKYGLGAVPVHRSTVLDLPGY